MSNIEIPEPRGFTEPSLSGRRVDLQPLNPQHYDFLLDLEWSQDRIAFNRFRGITPNPEAFVGAIWAGAVVHFVVVDRASGHGLGLVTLYNVDSRNGHGYIALASTQADEAGLGVVEGLALLIEYTFRLWPLHKLYAEVAEPNLANFKSAVDTIFDIEGRLQGHFFFDGQHWDQYLLAVHRSRWNDTVGQYRDLLGIGNR